MTVVQILFIAISVITVIAAILVVASPNLVHAALWLVLTLAGVAILFVMLQAGFLAVVQVVVYIGAIAILIIFAVMLTRRVMQDVKPHVNRYWWAGALTALLLFVGLVMILSKVPSSGTDVSQLPLPEGDLLSILGTALVDVNGFVLPFEVASVLLLAALIGSLVIARPPTERVEEGDAE